MSGTRRASRLMLVGLMCGFAGSAGAGERAETMELTMELHTRWNEVVVFCVPVEEGRPFRSEEASGLARHVVSGTVGVPDQGVYPVSLQLSRWADDKMLSLQMVTARVLPLHRWMSAMGMWPPEQLLTITLVPLSATDEGGEDAIQTTAN